MSDTTEKPEPTMIERQAVYDAVRTKLLEHPRLTFDMEPRNIRAAGTGKYSAIVISRANMLSGLVVDRIFKGAEQLTDNSYNYRVDVLSRAGEQAELLAVFRNVMRASPFKNGFFAEDLLKGTLEFAREQKTNNVAQEDALNPNDITEVPEPIEPLPLTRESLRASIRNFFDAKQELRFGRTTSGFTIAESTAQIRIDQITDVAMKALATEVNTLPAFKSRLTSMGKPESKLANAFTGYFQNNIASYPKSFYSGDAMTGYDATGKGNEYAEALCQHLKQWVKVDHVSVARSDTKAPGTKALAEKLAAKDGHDKGQSAA